MTSVKSRSLFLSIALFVFCIVPASMAVAQSPSALSFESKKAKVKSVTNVTASPPLHSSGGTTPNLTLPGVIIDDVNLNTAIGTDAMTSNPAGAGNTATGSETLSSNTTGFANTANGAGALFNNTVGHSNTAVGVSALTHNTIGNDNAAVGDSALSQNDSGSDNIAVGPNALEGNTTGSNNTAVGNDALGINLTGSNNTALGAGADVFSNSLDHATAIGAGAVVTASNKIQIGRNGSDVVAIGLLGGDAATHVCMANSIFSTCSSSLRYKENVQPFQTGLTLVERLRPVTFDWKSRKEHDLGLIAEEVAEVEPLLITYNHKGEIEGVKYDQLTVVLINAIKEEEEQIQRQQKDIDALKAALRAQADLKTAKLPKAH
jgi:Chaperone of endosialidase